MLTNDVGMRLDTLIQSYNLHSVPFEPISFRGLMEAYDEQYATLPHKVVAITARWRTERRQFVRVAYARFLEEESESARKRHATAHEFAHIFLRHRGDQFVMWEACEGLAKRSTRYQERQCEYVAAYLCLPGVTLTEWRHMVSWWVARRMDMPEHLVGLRWEIYQQLGR